MKNYTVLTFQKINDEKIFFDRQDNGNYYLRDSPGFNRKIGMSLEEAMAQVTKRIYEIQKNTGSKFKIGDNFTVSAEKGKIFTITNFWEEEHGGLSVSTQETNGFLAGRINISVIEHAFEWEVMGRQNISVPENYQILKMLSTSSHSTNLPSDEYTNGEDGEMVKWNADDYPDWIPVKNLLENKEYIIYQVKKLSTGEILTVGENLYYKRTIGCQFTNGEKIVSFEIAEGGSNMRARLANGSGWLLSNTDEVYSAHSKRVEGTIITSSSDNYKKEVEIIPAPGKGKIIQILDGPEPGSKVSLEAFGITVHYKIVYNEEILLLL